MNVRGGLMILKFSSTQSGEERLRTWAGLLRYVAEYIAGTLIRGTVRVGRNYDKTSIHLV